MTFLELKISPVMLTVILAGLMWLAYRHTPGFPITGGLQLIVVILLAAIAVLVGLAAVISFRKARTTVNPWTPNASSSLVKTGIFSKSRNPMYVALLIALLAWALYLANALALALAVVFVPYMNRFQIQPEERALEKTFGVVYQEYKNQVRRWI